MRDDYVADLMSVNFTDNYGDDAQLSRQVAERLVDEAYPLALIEEARHAFYASAENPLPPKLYEAIRQYESGRQRRAS